MSLFLSLLSGILLALPFCLGKLWIFAWFGFVPLFFALRGPGRLQSFLLSYLCGIIFWSITIYWLINVTLLGQILLILYLALYFGIFGVIVRRLSTIDHRLSTLLFVSSLWVLLEYLRAHLLTGFGWALLGYSQYLNLPIIQIADISGAYGVSFLVMMGNVVAYSVFSRQPSAFSKIKKCLVFALSLSIILAYGRYQLSRQLTAAWAIGGPTAAFWPAESRKLFNISLIQGNIPQELKWTPGAEGFILDRYFGLSQEAAKDNPALIIWPEASVPGFLGEDEWVFKAIFEKAKSIGMPILAGTVVRAEDKYFNSALLIDTQGEIAARYDKLHLVPFGEYIPLKNTFRFLETIVPIGDFTPGRDYTIFRLSEFSGAPAKFAVLICFEDTIPETSRAFVRKGADFLVNITNDGWFGRSSAPYQHLSASVFRAVENRVPLARAANTGVSCFIDSRGRIISSVREGKGETFIPGFKSQAITLGAKGSLYCRMGDIFVFGCLATVVFCGIIKNSKVKRQKSGF